MIPGGHLKRLCAAFVAIPVLLAAGDPAAKPDASTRHLFTCDYFTFDTQGNFQNKIRIQSLYARDLAKGTATWTHPGVSLGTTQEGTFGPAIRQDYMEGFSYPLEKAKEMLTPAFFSTFPEAPFVPMLKNLVWDTHMFEGFATEIDKLKLNEPFRPSYSTGDVDLGGKGSFGNNRIELTWIGNSTRNGKECRLIRYQTSVNQIKMPPLTGSSVYWGEIWVSVPDKQVEHATLHENVLMEFPGADPKAKIPKNIYRVGTFQKVAAE